ncbi:hypothetical protein Tco_0247002 [Tanacetum coccineum]
MACLDCGTDKALVVQTVSRLVSIIDSGKGQWCDDNINYSKFRFWKLFSCASGSKVGGSMHRIQAWNEVVDRVYARLSKWKMKTLSIRRRLESIRSHFFNGHDPNSKRTSWVKWKNVLASKEKGGLGVSSLVIKAIHGVNGKVGKQSEVYFPSFIGWTS